MNILLVYGTPVRRSVLLQAREALDPPAGTDIDLVTWADPEDDILDLVERVVILRPSSPRAARAAAGTEPSSSPDPGAPVAPGGPVASGDPVAPSTTDETDQTPAPAAATGPTFDGWSLARIRHGIGWRWRRLRRRFRPLKNRFRRLNWIFARHPGQVFWRHAADRPEVAMVAARSDVMIALDPVAALTCWKLARHHPGPDVVLGLTEGRLRVEARRGDVEAH